MRYCGRFALLMIWPIILVQDILISTCADNVDATWERCRHLSNLEWLRLWRMLK